MYVGDLDESLQLKLVMCLASAQRKCFFFLKKIILPPNDILLLLHFSSMQVEEIEEDFSDVSKYVFGLPFKGCVLAICYMDCTGRLQYRLRRIQEVEVGI